MVPLRRAETSGTYGAPIRLFKFTQGDGSGTPMCFTDTDIEVTFDSDTYTPIPIEMGTLKTEGRPSSDPLTVEVAANSQIATLFRGIPPRRVVSLQVFQGHAYDAVPEGHTPGADPHSGDPPPEQPDFVLLWSGRVLESNTKGSTTKLSCEPLSIGMERPGLNRFYTRECPHVLYGSRCQADKTAAKATVTVTTVGTRSLTLPSGWSGSLNDSDFIGGTVEWPGPHGVEVRMVLFADDTTVRLDGPINDLDDGDDVDVFLGCPRTLTACRDLHDNVVNFGGTPFIPLENPFGKNVHT